MIMALLKIRSCFVDKGLGDQVSPLRMVVHALSYLIYVATYMVLAIINWSTSETEDYYFSWAVDTFFGLLSYICLFFVIWHLGTKTNPKDALATSGSTIMESSDPETESEYTDSLRVQKILVSQQQLLELNTTEQEQEEP